MNTQPADIKDEQELSLQRTPPRTLVNGSTSGTYTPAAWTVRAGGTTTCSTHRKGSEMRRITYVLQFARWLLVHRSWSSAKWVMDFEGKNWK